ncbi:hypothetical protein TEA_023601 [Camellia sinensis var. sinensis]|uniref:Uncharacterized protein n=1 Tax=Camellia sinensis var. sinensis TaxID=542762 RepID=A0A4S4EV45_CAMSN|nr:hypothetical protein TEA_023601 [Camellia sinensis var. sinensis]
MDSSVFVERFASDLRFRLVLSSVMGELRFCGVNFIIFLAEMVESFILVFLEEIQNAPIPKRCHFVEQRSSVSQQSKARVEDQDKATLSAAEIGKIMIANKNSSSRALRSVIKDLLQFVAITIWKLICVLFDIVSHIHFKRFVGSLEKAREFSKLLWRGGEVILWEVQGRLEKARVNFSGGKAKEGKFLWREGKT